MSHFNDLIDAVRQVDPAPLVPVVRDCRARDGTLFLAGNGGSYANALHWACDLTKVCGVRTYVLGVNGALLTAWANDDDYDHAIEDDLRRLARTDDALIALSCSGTSKNIGHVLGQARFQHLPTALLTGIVSPIVAPADLTIRIPSTDYGVIEDCFSAIGHWLTKELTP